MSPYVTFSPKSRKDIAVKLSFSLRPPLLPLHFTYSEALSTMILFWKVTMLGLHMGTQFVLLFLSVLNPCWWFWAPAVVSSQACWWWPAPVWILWSGPFTAFFTWSSPSGGPDTPEVGASSGFSFEHFLSLKLLHVQTSEPPSISPTVTTLDLLPVKVTSCQMLLQRFLMCQLVLPAFRWPRFKFLWEGPKWV